MSTLRFEARSSLVAGRHVLAARRSLADIFVAARKLTAQVYIVVRGSKSDLAAYGAKIDDNGNFSVDAVSDAGLVILACEVIE